MVDCSVLLKLSFPILGLLQDVSSDFFFLVYELVYSDMGHTKKLKLQQQWFLTCFLP